MAAAAPEPGGTLAPAPTLSRRHAAGATSARGLLFTVLGEFVLPGGRRAWTSAVIEVLRRLGVEEKATRQALMRTAADGWLDSERVGRRTCWTLTPLAEKLLVDGTERIYTFTASSPDWDGRWLLALARAPESERPARHLLRTRLTWAGLGSPAPGVWISPHAERVAEVEQVLDSAGVLADAQVFVAEHRGHGDLQQMTRQAWDLDEIAARYVEFSTRFDARSADQPLAGTVELVHAWRRFPWIDPGLPDHLLPPQWAGHTAAETFARVHARLAQDARVEWQALNEAAR